MGAYFSKVDRFAISLTKVMVRWRWAVVFLMAAFVVFMGSGGRFLEFSNNYRAFFSEENPELTAFESLQTTYTKNDNFTFVIVPESGNIFNQDTLKAVEQLTEQAWSIPYALRVDSVTNFQHTHSIEDDLIVEDLVKDAENLSDADLVAKAKIALSEPLLLHQLVSKDKKATAVNVVLQYPEESLSEVPEAAAKARELRDQLVAQYPDTKVYLTGVSMLNNAFAEAGFNDIGTLMPLMFMVILVVTLIILRSPALTLITMLVIIMSSVVGMGAAGFIGIELTPISGSAPIVILTLAIADSVHILISLRSAMQSGMNKIDGIVDALRINFLPVTITSITTIVGFLSLNFSDSPPFWHLGNITAIGIAAAWLFSVTLLPALVAILPYRVKPLDHDSFGTMTIDRLADFVIERPKKLLILLSLLCIILISFIPRIEFNDQWIHYFSEEIEFRRDSDQSLQYFGMYPVEFSVPANGSGGISEPEYLENLDRFAEFLRGQSQVVHVYSVANIMKRLNKNLHGDDPAYYRIPEDRELAAQYLLLYEISLPYGLDLNDRINVDKSATRVTATLTNSTTEQTKEFLSATDNWVKENFPDYMQTAPTGAQVMFTYITDRNVDNMIAGTLMAIIAIAFIMMLSLRSMSLGFLSLIPNGLPILVTFGAWSLLVGQVGFSVATVASISLGIIVDDTVHFLSKFVRARRERGLTTAESIRYAFHTVGVAIVVNTVILSIGFFVLTTSSFKVNVDMGLLTSMAIIFALILDFLFLPALLLMLDKSAWGSTLFGEKSHA